MIVATCAALAPPAAAAPAGLPSSAGGRRLSSTFSNAETFPNLPTALAFARTHSVLVLSQGWQLGYVRPWDGSVAGTYYDEMVAANPKLVILRYLNAVYTGRGDLPESWYLHNAAGNRLWNSVYANYLMDPRSTAPWTGRPPFARAASTSHGWIEYLANWYRADRARFPRVFKGVWLDDVGGTPQVVDKVTGQPAHAARDASGATFSLHEWYGLTASVAARVNRLVGGYVFGNALLSAECYYTGCGGSLPTSYFFGAGIRLDAAMAEGWLRNWWDSPSRFPSPDAWRQSVQMLIDANRAGRAVQVTTALPSSATNAEVARWRSFAYGTFLLANQGLSYFQLAHYGRPPGAFEMANRLYRLDIGRPLSSATSVSSYARMGYYSRRYRKGAVLVNPTPAAVAVPLGGTYRRPDGSVVTRVVLAPHSAQILRTKR